MDTQTSAAGAALQALLTEIDFARLERGHWDRVRARCDELLTESGLDDPAFAELLCADLFAAKDFLALLQRPELSDVLVNRADRVYVEENGRLRICDLRFSSEQHLRRMASWFAAGAGRPVGPDRPMVDVRLFDGSRLNVVLPPVAVDGTTLSIRRFQHKELDLEGLARSGSLPPPALPLLRGMVAAKLNLLIIGGTGSGKTTLLNALSESIPPDERIVTIEDAAELRLRQEHVVRLESRLPDLHGDGGVRARDLVRNALRMRPDRILVGEVRGEEVIDMLQAMTTGHEGSMSTLHANSPRDALDRLEMMAALGGLRIPTAALRGQLARALDAILHVQRSAEGKRVLAGITEVGRLQGDVIGLQDLLLWEGGRFRATGVRPGFATRIEASGQALPASSWRIDWAP